MSSYRREPFDVTKGDQGGWIVDFEGTPIPVESQCDALLLANLPVQLYKAVATDQQADWSEVKRILRLCADYSLGHIHGVNQLKRYYERKQNDD